MKPATRQTILWLSLGLNVAFVLALAGVAIFPEASARIIATDTAPAASPDAKPPHHGGDRERSGDPLKREFYRIAKVIELEPAQRERIEAMLDACKKEGRSLYSQMKDERVKAFKSILSDPADDASFAKIIADSHDMHEAMALDMLSRFRAMVRELTAEQRAKLIVEFDNWDSKDGPPPPPAHSSPKQ
ncbi:Spy/CpxP family protein refolding chaperone [Candidatus Sumerlaeota bacterium]|nr:Spy/CpxP family protein refolding chaperone [Candidatus Sumerlaeota bacterium]